LPVGRGVIGRRLLSQLRAAGHEVDDPAPTRDWIPVFAQAVGAPRQPRVPRRVARLMAGSWAVATLTAGRGASNARAKRKLGWHPRYRSWREGFFVRDEPHFSG
jgi:hypothetical protein